MQNSNINKNNTASQSWTREYVVNEEQARQSYQRHKYQGQAYHTWKYFKNFFFLITYLTFIITFLYSFWTLDIPQWDDIINILGILSLHRYRSATPVQLLGHTKRYSSITDSTVLMKLHIYHIEIKIIKKKYHRQQCSCQIHTFISSNIQ